MNRGLFGDIEIPQTEGIKYAGSKLKLLPYIINEIKNVKDIHSIIDAFSGTTRVSQAFAQLGYQVTANDISEWSEVFGECYLKASKPKAYYQNIIDELNKTEGYNGWFSEHYGGNESSGKRPFQIHNTQKLDAIRDNIDKWNLEWEDKCVILTSLILALDAVDNTLGHFVSYLSGWSARSYNPLKMKVPRKFPLHTTHTVSKKDVFDAVKNYHDLAYLDPPYGSNNEKMPPSRVRYASYYHIWKTVILNDKPLLFGKANRREDTRDTVSTSVFEEFKKDNQGKFIAMQAINKLIAETNTHYILLSYSSGGRTTKEELFDIIHSHGKLISAKEIDYKKNIMASFTWTNEWLNDSGTHKEYLFLMEK